jgi:enoyl-CoA hydratase/carnithine racemase
MNFEQIRLDVADYVATLELHRPAERNAMTPAMGREIRAAVDQLNADPAVRVVVIRGAGKSFCSGADLSTLGKEAGVGDDGEGLGGSENFYRAFLSIRDLAVPSIAAINGHAIGAGLCFTLGADLRVMREDAKAGMTFTRLGIHPGMAATWNLPRLIGPALAAELLYTGRLFDGNEALAMGLVNRVAKAEEFDAVVAELAAAVAEAAPIAVRGVKATLRGAFDRTLDDALAREAAVQEKTFTTADAAEGIRAIREKRRPDFKGC